MKKMDEITKAMQSELATPSNKSQEKISSKTDLPNSWIAWLFKKFQIRYGHKWTSRIDGIEREAVQEWASELSGLTSNEFRTGYEAWKDSWPPSIDEYRDSCKPNKNNEFGLGYTPEVYRQSAETNRDRLLSSDARDAKRKGFKRGIRDLRASLEKLRSADAAAKKPEKFVSDPVRRKEIEDELKAMGFLE